MLKLGKGWRKWLMIGFLVILGALAVLAFTTGCSSGSSEPATTTPLQALQNDIDAVETITDQLAISAAGNSNSISVLETWKAGIETWKASVNEKITNLETGGLPEANLSGIEARLTFLELQYEGIINSGISTPTPTPTGTVTPTPTPTATPTPSLTPTMVCGTSITLKYPQNEATNIPIAPTFMWEPVTGISYYELVVSGYSAVKTSNPYFAWGSPYSPFDGNTSYSWSVYAYTTCDTIVPSELWVFTTTAP